MNSLVSYDSNSSDEEEDEDESSSSFPVVSSSSSKNLREDDLDKKERLRQAFALKFEELLPKPTPITTPFEAVEEIGPIPPKKIYGDEEAPPPITARIGIGLEGKTEVTSKRSAKGVMQISIPSLKDFENDSDEESPARRMKNLMAGDKKGSGLFAILPEPKAGMIQPSKFPKPAASTVTGIAGTLSTTTTTTTSKSVFGSLIPHAVQQTLAGKRPAEVSERLAQVRAKYMKQESNFKIVSHAGTSSTSTSTTKRKKDKDASDDSSDEEAGSSMDFFSLEEGANPVDLTGVNLDDYRVNIPDTDRPEFNEQEQGAAGYSSMDVDEVAGELEVPVNLEPTYQEDLMKYIQPDRKQRMGKGQHAPINIIDINADDLRPHSTEWLKTITDKSIIPPRKANLPGGMSKRKHQITYLAAEAKAREEELQNQWAQNRHSRRQTQNKYGF